MTVTEIHKVLTVFNQLTHSNKWKEVKFDLHTAELIKQTIDESEETGCRGL